MSYATVADLLEAPERWTTGEEARDGVGLPCDLDSVNARSWCVLGACAHVYDFTGDRHAWALEALRNALHDMTGQIVVDIDVWQDAPGRTHAEVLSVVRKAGI